MHGQQNIKNAVKFVKLVIKVCFDFVIKNMKYYKWYI
jgi:hypothetical protein